MHRFPIQVFFLLALCAGCSAVNQAPTPSPPVPDFRVLVDIGLFGGPPALPPPYHIAELGDDTLLVVVDRGISQGLREVRWGGTRWEVVAAQDGRLMPVREEGPYLRTLEIRSDAGFTVDAVLLLARVPSGPIGRLDVEVDGGVKQIFVVQRPVFVTVFPAGTHIGEEFIAFDHGTIELERGVIHHD